jgi:hypothetical protein
MLPLSSNTVRLDKTEPSLIREIQAFCVVNRGANEATEDSRICPKYAVATAVEFALQAAQVTSGHKRQPFKRQRLEQEIRGLAHSIRITQSIEMPNLVANPNTSAFHGALPTEGCSF